MSFVPTRGSSDRDDRAGGDGAGRAAPYTLVRRARSPAAAPALDPAQRSVVDHPGGPLLVLAGPGTGKTTTIVEAVVARIQGGLDPEQVLVLTFARKAAAELRARIVARLGRATREPLARTFHSYAFGILRREAALRGDPAPRLLSGPEQDLVIRQLLDGDLADGALGWPERLRPALQTRGFVQELRDLLMRADERGLTPADLDRLGREQRRDDWRAAARFMRQYADVSGFRDPGAYDPAELIRAVIGLWGTQPEVLAHERAARTAVFVDELQDTDPAQVLLLHQLAGDGRDLTAVGDPDQSIYGFRGADVAGIASFSERFRTRDGAAAPVVALDVSRRAGVDLLAASRRVATGLGGRGVHRALTAADGLPPGESTVALLRSQTQEATYVAGRLREAHLRDGVPWSRMAVVVRSTVVSLPTLRRAFAVAGVPVDVVSEELPLAGQPAVRPLLTLLRCIVDADRLDEDVADDLLRSSFGRADVVALRRLRQDLRRLELADGGGRSSGALLVEALTDPRVLLGLRSWVARPAERMARLLAVGRAEHARPDATAEDVLWAVWSASGLAERWARQSLEGGLVGAAADRDLDAVVALFESAARFGDRLPGARAELFLDHVEGQQIPADSLAPRAATGDAVTVLTAHASKGLEWDLVCVAGVQEGLWPSSRMRGSFLGSERLVDVLRPETAQLSEQVGAVATLSRLLDEERRLFYVAVTRARRWLFVTAVASEREGLAPSRFLDELDPLDVDQIRPVTEVRRPLSLPALVAELRQSAEAAASAPPAAAVRESAAAELARLAAAGVRGASPETWWGLAPLSDDQPVRGDDESVQVSPSRVEAFRSCQLRWFLEQVGASGTTSVAQGVGTVVHAVAESAADDASSTEAALLAELEQRLPAVDLGSGWSARQQAAKARDMIGRLAEWLARHHHEVVAAEVDFRVDVGRALVGGRVDRLERDDEGRAVVIDFKTGSSKAADLEQHPQLAAYQVAVEAGAFADYGLTESGGAALVQLGKAGGKGPAEQVQPPLSTYDDPGWARALVVQVADGMAGSVFHAVENDRCRICPVRASCPVQPDGRAVTS